MEMMRYTKSMYAEESKANDVMRRVREYWGDGYMVNQLIVYLEQTDEEDTKPNKVRAKSAVLHRKPNRDDQDDQGTF